MVSFMKFRKLIANSIVLAMVGTSMSMTSVSAVDVSASVSKEMIMDKYRQNVAEVYATSISPEYVNVESYMKQTVNELNTAGYEAYYVSSETYDEVEAELKTDLSDMQLSPEYSYIITLGDGNPQTRADYRDEHEFTYNGTTYTIRPVTIDASDGDIRYSQTKPVDMLATFGDELIQNIINTAITGYADYVSGGVVGTIASILGFDYTDYLPGRQHSLIASCYAEWNRTYYQVLNPYDGYWYNGSYTEYADYGMHLTGSLYNNNKGKYDHIVEESVISRREEAPDYYDGATLNRNAVIGYLGGYTIGDPTGGIHIEYTYTHDFDDADEENDLVGEVICYFPETF